MVFNNRQTGIKFIESFDFGYFAGYDTLSHNFYASLSQFTSNGTT